MDTLITLSAEALDNEILFRELALPNLRKMVVANERELKELYAEKAKRLGREVAA